MRQSQLLFLLPWSEWAITSCFGFRFQTAINEASMAKSMDISDFIDQSTT
jgi:hypothetical protein